MKSKRYTVFTALLFLLFVNFDLPAQTNSTEIRTENDQVHVYYFHFTVRCVTCKTVESETRKDVKEIFGNDVQFAAYNLDEPEGTEKGRELGVNTLTLLVVSGAKKINLTTQGFLYASTKPEKFKKIIKETIKPLL